jgi:hypothetical protein
VNAIDELELAYLEHTGDIEVAEMAGRIARERIQSWASAFGVSIDELLDEI